MNKEQKMDIAKREINKFNDKDISHYDFIVFSDSEYNNLSRFEEEELDIKYSMLCGNGFVLYYKYIK